MMMLTTAWSVMGRKVDLGVWAESRPSAADPVELMQRPVWSWVPTTNSTSSTTCLLRRVAKAGSSPDPCLTDLMTSLASVRALMSENNWVMRRKQH